MKANEILTLKTMLAIVEFKAFDLIVYLQRWVEDNQSNDNHKQCSKGVQTLVVADQCALLQHCRINSFSFFGIHLKQNDPLTDNILILRHFDRRSGLQAIGGGSFSKKAYYIWPCITLPARSTVDTLRYYDEGLNAEMEEVSKEVFLRAVTPVVGPFNSSLRRQLHGHTHIEIVPI